ncbi:hypothetical protein ACFL4H_00050 [Candidatus Neomarinimicrobiota bacterium]
MPNYDVTTKIITHNRISNRSDTTYESGGEDSMAKAITDYLGTVDNTFTIHYIGVTISELKAVATIIHNKA